MDITPKNVTKTYSIAQIDVLQREFYGKYDVDHWLYRASQLKNCHDNFDSMREMLCRDLGDVRDDDYRRAMRTEMHFLYFQMIETLFEIIFALRHDNRNLWLALTFSNDRKSPFYSDTYKAVGDLNESSPLFNSKVKTEIGGEGAEIPFLRWVFYFVHTSKMSTGDWEKNLENIKKLLLNFASDFSDRDEYNAFKHSLRFYNIPFSLAVGPDGSKPMLVGVSEDSIVYLEEKSGDDPSGAVMVSRTVKPFDFESDFKRCLTIHSLIKNIIDSRKHAILPELIGKPFNFMIFDDIDAMDLFKGCGVTKFSMTQ